MINKERLEEIKNSYLEGIHRLFGSSWVSMPKENCDWLIEQAERVEKLEKENKQLKADVNAMENEIVHGNKSIEFETYRKCVRGEIDEI